MEKSSISIKNFEVIEELGTGSFGKVQLVKNRFDGQFYAMKSVLLSKLNQKQRQNALNQVRLLASIRIPYVISYKGAFFNTETQSLCVIMQYANGGDLQNKIIERSDKFGKGFEQTYIWKVAYQLLNALKRLHSNKIVHRDIKAANIFFANDIAKLGDLNVSKVVDNGYCQTQTGTPYYISPQIWNGQKYTEKCDIWSFGCVIYEMCMLQPPFRASDLPALFRKVNTGQYTQIPNNYSSDLKDLIKICLTVNYKQRPSAQQLLETSTLSGMQLAFECFKNDDDEIIELIDPIKCPKVLKFLNNRLPKSQVSKKNVEFVTKKQIQYGDNQEGHRTNLRKILSQKIINVNFERSYKYKTPNKSIKQQFTIFKGGSRKQIKLPPQEKDISQHLTFTTFTAKKVKTQQKLKLNLFQNFR